MAVTARLRTAATSNIRDYVILEGALDGSNRVFTLPGGEKAIHSPGGGVKLKPYHNTRRMLDEEVSIEESGGVGTGYDTVRFLAFAPTPRSKVFADYVVS